MIEVIAPNIKRRLSGVTATVAGLVPIQAGLIGIAATGPGLPPGLPHVALARIPFLPRRTRVWHARRNSDLAVGLVLKWIFRAPLRMIFTSSSPRARSAWTRWLLARCDALVATSARNAEVMPKALPLRIIPHGIDTTHFAPRPRGFFGLGEQKVIGCFGRLREKKGSADLVAALCEVLPDHPGWTSVLMGRITQKEEAFAAELRATIARAGLADRILLRPETAWPQMPEAYSDLDLYVAPSHYEGFGLTPLEAMACGVPVIATSGVGTFDDQVAEGETGLLVPPAEPRALAQALRRLMEDETRAAMAAAARPRVLERFRIEDEARALVALYRELLA